MNKVGLLLLLFAAMANSTLRDIKYFTVWVGDFEGLKPHIPDLVKNSYLATQTIVVQEPVVAQLKEELIKYHNQKVLVYNDGGFLKNKLLVKDKPQRQNEKLYNRFTNKARTHYENMGVLAADILKSSIMREAHGPTVVYDLDVNFLNIIKSITVDAESSPVKFSTMAFEKRRSNVIKGTYALQSPAVVDVMFSEADIPDGFQFSSKIMYSAGGKKAYNFWTSVIQMGQKNIAVFDDLKWKERTHGPFIDNKNPSLYSANVIRDNKPDAKYTLKKFDDSTAFYRFVPSPAFKHRTDLVVSSHQIRTVFIEFLSRSIHTKLEEKFYENFYQAQDEQNMIMDRNTEIKYALVHGKVSGISKWNSNYMLNPLSFGVISSRNLNSRGNEPADWTEIPVAKEGRYTHLDDSESDTDSDDDYIRAEDLDPIGPANEYGYVRTGTLLGVVGVDFERITLGAESRDIAIDHAHDDLSYTSEQADINFMNLDSGVRSFCRGKQPKRKKRFALSGGGGRAGRVCKGQLDELRDPKSYGNNMMTKTSPPRSFEYNPYTKAVEVFLGSNGVFLVVKIPAVVKHAFILHGAYLLEKLDNVFNVSLGM